MESEVQPRLGPRARSQPLPRRRRKKRNGLLSPRAGPLRTRARQSAAVYEARLDHVERDAHGIARRLRGAHRSGFRFSECATASGAHDATKTGFQARSVVGGVFLKLLYDDGVWKKWARR